MHFYIPFNLLKNSNTLLYNYNITKTNNLIYATFDPNQSNKRTVQKGSDPIHN